MHKFQGLSRIVAVSCLLTVVLLLALHTRNNATNYKADRVVTVIEATELGCYPSLAGGGVTCRT